MPVDVSSALDLKLNSRLTYKQIAAIQGMSPQRVHQVISALIPDNEKVNAYITHRADLLASAQLKLLEAFDTLDSQETKELVLKRGMVDYGILHDKERDIRGQNDSNIKPMIVIVKGNGPVQINAHTNELSTGSTNLPLSDKV
jgi:hypothetical protein